MKLLSDISDYDRIIVSLSGGKDSVACVLWLIDQGIKPGKIELWHQCIDGKGDTHKAFFDWPSTEGYVREFAKQFDMLLGWQWRAHGFYGELTKENARSHGIYYQYEGMPDFIEHLPTTTKAAIGTRRKWPAKGADLGTRWCSGALKIDVASRVMQNAWGYTGTIAEPVNILFITGERREESANRAKYAKAEKHRTWSKSRNIHHLRPVIDLKEKAIWDMMEKYQVLPHPAYYLGFPRLSCRSCIFYSKDHWTTLNEVDHKAVKMLADMERELNFTIDHKLTIPEVIKIGKSDITSENRKWIPRAITEWHGSIISKKWNLPAGAFGKGGGAV